MALNKNNDELSRALMAWQDSKTEANHAVVWDLLLPLIERCIKTLFFAWRLGRSGNEIEDCVEEVVLHILEKNVLETWDRSRAPAGPYIRVVTLRRLSDLMQRTDLLRLAVRDGLEQIEGCDTPETLLLAAAQRADLRALLDSILPAGELAIYEMLYERGLSQGEAATALGLSEAAVAKRHERLKARVQAAQNL